MRARTLSAGAGVLLALAPPAAAQLSSAWLVEGEALPPPYQDQVVAGFGGTTANGVGGYAVVVHSQGPQGNLSHVWGHAAGGPGGLLRTQGTLAGWTQTRFERLIDLDDSGGIAYLAALSNGPVPGGASLWRDDALVLAEGQPHPSIPGWFWSIVSEPRITAAGLYYVAGLATLPGGFFDDVGWFVGDGTSWILKGHQMVPGLAAPLEPWGPFSWESVVSRSGARYLAWVDTSGPVGADEAVVHDGALMRLGAHPVQEGQPIAPQVGGLPGESWSRFRFTTANDQGRVCFTARTTAPEERDEVLVFDGALRFREGDLVAGYRLVGGPEALVMNEHGQVAWVWWTESTPADGGRALFVDDQLLVREGDGVDLDGDGLPDPDTTLTRFDLLGRPSIGTDGWVGFIGQVDLVATPTFPDDDLRAFLRVRARPGVAYCPAGPNSTGEPAVARAQGSASVSANDLVLVAEPVPAGLGLFYYGAQKAALPFANGTRCVGGTLFRLLPYATAGRGSLVQALDLASPPSLAGTITPGSTWNFQAWFMDLPAGGAGRDLSNGLEITFLP